MFRNRNASDPLSPEHQLEQVWYTLFQLRYQVDEMRSRLDAITYALSSELALQLPEPKAVELGSTLAHEPRLDELEPGEVIALSERVAELARQLAVLVPAMSSDPRQS